MMPAPGFTNAAASHADTRLADEALVLCELGELTLAVPQADIVTIEHRAELSASDAMGMRIGCFNGANGSWPAFALDSDLNPLPAARASGSFVVFVNAHPLPLGLLCESVRLVRKRSELNIQPLPVVMRSQSGALRGVSRIDNSRLVLALGEGGLAASLAEIAARETGNE